MTAKIKLNAASGGGSFSLQAPSSSSNNRVITLPDIADGTLLTSQSTLDSTKLSPAITGGKILQTVTVSDSVRGTSGSVSLSSAGTYYATPFTVTITPSATSSKILLMGHVFGEFSIDDYLFMWMIERAISGGATTDILAPAAGNRARGISIPPAGFYVSENSSTPTVMNFSGLVDSPNTTSAVTYTFQVTATQNDSQTFYYNRTVNNENAYNRQHSVSWLTLEEIGA